MAKATIIQAPIKGALGTEVQVGDTVMVVTTGWGNTHCTKGKYLGYVEGNGYYKRRAKVEVQEKAYVRYWKDTNEKFHYSGERERNMMSGSAYYDILRDQTVVKEEPYARVTTLNLNRIASLKD